MANPWTVSCVLGENGELGKEEEEARDELRFHTKVVDEEVEPGRERERLDAHFQGERQLKLPVVRQNPRKSRILFSMH